MKQLRILHALGTLNPGGVELWLLRLLRTIDTSKFKFDFCLFGAELGSYAPEVQQLGSVIHHCPQSPSYSLGRRFRHILRQGHYDIVHSHVHFFSGALLRWASLEAVPMRIAHSHSSIDDNSNSVTRHGYRWLMKRWIQRYATHGMACSRKAADDLFSTHWQEDPHVAILHNGIDLPAFRSSSEDHRWSQYAGLRNGHPVIGHVSNFVPAKNHAFFLEVASHILQRRPQVHFLMVGDGPLRAEVQAQAKTLGLEKNMRFLGTRNDVPALLRECIDTFLFPSIWEGLPIAVLEAQAAGLRCVISNNITDEVVIFPERVLRLPLSIGPAEWANKTIATMDRGKFDSGASAQAMAKTDFCIERSALNLTNMYLSTWEGARASSA